MAIHESKKLRALFSVRHEMDLPRKARSERSAIFTSTFAREPFKAEVKVTIKPGIGNDTASVDAAWDDSWFECEATTYIHDLAIASMALSGAAYVEDSDTKPIPDSIQNALGELGFDEIVSCNYDTGKSSSR